MPVFCCSQLSSRRTSGRDPSCRQVPGPLRLWRLALCWQQQPQHGAGVLMRCRVGPKRCLPDVHSHGQMEGADPPGKWSRTSRFAALPQVHCDSSGAGWCTAAHRRAQHDTDVLTRRMHCGGKWQA